MLSSYYARHFYVSPIIILVITEALLQIVDIVKILPKKKKLN